MYFRFYFNNKIQNRDSSSTIDFPIKTFEITDPLGLRIENLSIQGARNKRYRVVVDRRADSNGEGRTRIENL